MKDQDGPILGRVKLYGIVLANMIGWAAYQLLARLLRGAHPMKWSAEQVGWRPTLATTLVVVHN